MAKKVAPAAAGFVDIELSKPIEIDGAQVTALRMREPTVGDQLMLDDMKAGDATKEVTLVANLCEIAPDDVKRLTLRDYRKVQEAFAGFIT
ncbi:MAG: phage tail assembly protein [Lautropia mirabilis]|nr:phage tail assembly protein [Lautropia mirabilis]